MSDDEDNPRPEEAQRLVEARRRRGFSDAKAAAAYFGWNYTTYSQHERGERGLRRQVAERYAKAFRVSHAWLATGEGSLEDSSREVVIMGRIGAGARIEPDYEQVPPDGYFSVESLVPIPPDAIGFEVVGDSMYPRYDEGDVIVCMRDGVPIENIGDGEEVVVRTTDGARYLKVIYREPSGSFILQSFNAPPIHGVYIEWVSDIRTIVRRAKWRRMNGVDRVKLFSTAARARDR
jgi:phage repressor protein C with HTH and peptisase S24 domain